MFNKSQTFFFGKKGKIYQESISERNRNSFKYWKNLKNVKILKVLMNFRVLYLW